MKTKTTNQLLIHSRLAGRVCQATPGMEELTCFVQQYAWGKFGLESAVARIKSSDPAFSVSDSEPYAEIWMGTHPNGPSKMVRSGMSLYDWLQAAENASAIGIVPEGYPALDVPFMFKVLSIRTALSIQAHPDKTLAPILHASQPDIYKDPNHKPEMCVALTPLEAMKGFRPLSEIRDNLEQFPELKSLVGEDAVAQFLRYCDGAAAGVGGSGAGEREEQESKALEVLFGAFLRCPVERATLCVKALVERLEGTANSIADELPYLCGLILRLHNDYPGDPGIFGPLLLNCLQLTPGQAFFMQANEPHAYIKGDIVEVMALSDNVVRAGLTPKFKDVETLCKMLEYRCIQDVHQCLVQPIQLDPYCTLYRPPFKACQEFEVEMVALPASRGPEVYIVQQLPCASILLFVQASGASYTPAESSDAAAVALHDGAICFLAANKSVAISATEQQQVLLYRAHINLGK